MKKKYIMHVISGVHWDREWRQTEVQSKMKLVQLMDSVIDLLERKPSYKSFCIDGGSVVLEDYFSIRPENKKRFIKLAKENRLSYVPWYTLPEMNTVAAESLVRNILIGKKVGKEYSGEMRSGFTACSYGQISQLPQIYKAFGIDSVIFYRGINQVRFPTFFIWEGKDGSKLYAKQCTDMYCRSNWMWLVHYPLVLNKIGVDLLYNFDPDHQTVHMCNEELYERPFIVLNEDYSYEDSKEKIGKVNNIIRDQAIPDAVEEHLLGMFIEDNTGPYKYHPEIIEIMNKQSNDMKIVQDTWDDYIDTIVSEIDEDKLLVHKGEIRYPGVKEGFGGLLGATHSSRIKLKILNEQAETMLIYHAEPMASIAGILGEFNYPDIFLESVWKLLLQNHAHDSICGAAVDQVHTDMLYRFSTVKTAAEEITISGIESIHKHIDLSEFKECDYTFTIYNNLNQPRKEVILLVVDIPKMKPPKVDFDPAIDFRAIEDKIEFFDIIDNHNNNIEYVILRKDDINIGIQRPIDTLAAKFPATRRRLLIEAEIPAMGYTTYALKKRKPKYIKKPSKGIDRPLIARDNNTLENEFMRININPNGTFMLYSKILDKTFKDLHYFTDFGEVGTAHFSIKPEQDVMVSSIGKQVSISMIESSNLRGVFKIELKLSVPKAATIDGKDRLEETIDIPIAYWLTLEKNSKYLKIKTRLENNARDHKLKVNFPTGISTDFATSESAFSIEKRPIQWEFTGDNFEKFYEFKPMQNFVDVSDGKIGMAILNKGLREYEVIDDKDRTIAITLLRTHRAYMTANSNMIPDEFEKYTGLHSFGKHEYHYALYPHIGDWEKGKVMTNAYQHKVALNAIQGVPKNGDLPSRCSFFQIEPFDDIMLASLKQSEDKKGYILRVWNTTNKIQKVKISTVFNIESASFVNLDEVSVEKISVKKNVLRFEMLPCKITTIKIRFGELKK